MHSFQWRRTKTFFPFFYLLTRRNSLNNRVYRRRVTFLGRPSSSKFTCTLITAGLEGGGACNNRWPVRIQVGSEWKGGPTSLCFSASLACFSRACSRVHTWDSTTFGVERREREREGRYCIWVALHCWLSRSWKIGWAKLWQVVW